MKFTKRIQIAVLLILTVCIYANSLWNEYALDDRAIITDNSVTKKGLSAITDIFTHHYYYDGITHNTYTYRPITSLTHAIEWQLFQKNLFISHLINLLLYLLTLYILFRLLGILFELKEKQSFIPFTATLLFAFHPIHTEVIANIKGRDEILSLLFVLIAMYYLLIKRKNVRSPKIYLVTGSLFFIGLLCKENALLFLLFLPLVNYFFSTDSVFQSIKKTIPFLIPVIIYAIIISQVIGFGEKEDRMILNVPYLYATAAEALATKIFVLFKYISLLIIPNPLICDYTFNHIPYIPLSDYRFWGSAILLAGLLFTAIYLFKRKNVFSFCILFYFISISIVSNLVFQTGVIMAERSVYTGSLAFCLGLSYLLHLSVLHAAKSGKAYLTKLNYALFIIVATGYSVLVFNRNKDWKSDYYLFTHDVKYAPNSVKLLQLAAFYEYFQNPLVKKGELPDNAIRDKCIQRLKKAIEILPITLPESYLYLSYIYTNTNSLDSSLYILEEARKKDMYTPQLTEARAAISNRYLSIGDSCFQQKDVTCAFNHFKKATEVNENNARAWWNYGGIFLDKGDIPSTIIAWEKVIAIDPAYPKASELLQFVKNSIDSISTKK